MLVLQMVLLIFLILYFILVEYEKDSKCLLCTSAGGYYENCTKCAYAASTLKCTECIATYFLRNSE